MSPMLERKDIGVGHRYGKGFMDETGLVLEFAVYPSIKDKQKGFLNSLSC